MTLSGNPLGIPPDADKIDFGVFFVLKDIFGIFFMAFVCTFFVAFYPNVLSHSDNYIPANELVTPNHIVPE
jgi:quinol-cytochrome oxidoreductase complex cytochrome b subunit